MDNVIVFHNTVLEKEIRKKLCIPEGPINMSDLQKITALECIPVSGLYSEEGLYDEKDMEILRNCNNLEGLTLNIWKTDLSFIRSFPRLKWLVLGHWSGSKDWDFNVLRECTMLEELTIDGHLTLKGEYYVINNLVPLQTLKYLSVRLFGGLDLKFLEGMTSLEHIDFREGGKLIHTESIKSLKNLKSLSLDELSLDSLDFIDALPDDIDLTLGGLRVRDDFDLSSLKRFKECDAEELIINGKFYLDI